MEINSSANLCHQNFDHRILVVSFLSGSRSHLTGSLLHPPFGLLHLLSSCSPHSPHVINHPRQRPQRRYPKRSGRQKPCNGQGDRQCRRDQNRTEQQKNRRCYGKSDQSSDERQSGEAEESSTDREESDDSKDLGFWRTLLRKKAFDSLSWVGLHLLLLVAAGVLVSHGRWWVCLNKKWIGGANGNWIVNERREEKVGDEYKGRGKRTRGRRVTDVDEKVCMKKWF